ncbi:hypothetical protein L7F22_067268 [Adiantum nelumboides]|nr:hypothetical protein [Adiantum nelumboides]
MGRSLDLAFSPSAASSIPEHTHGRGRREGHRRKDLFSTGDLLPVSIQPPPGSYKPYLRSPSLTLQHRQACTVLPGCSMLMNSPAMEREQSSPSLSSKTREKILVTVRVRPLSNRELQQQDVTAWDCTDDRTIVLRPPQSNLPERSPHHQPKSYTFDHVFGPECVTQQVYEEGAKDVALSALSGINATIFAYGQTSSGKTFTMRGITENAVSDIYSYIQKHHERDFVVKISALEIYNEVVRDLLNTDTSSGPLRLMDDPEKGTIIERLSEYIVRDIEHLRQVLSVIEAQRQVGETMLNETSSRSHQIIRLTMESFPQDIPNGGLVKSLVATLNLVDLAGSERASQTHSEGTRLKEGCHINRSLLTLTTIIRKLSGQGRAKTGHLPYRDSKLTRILQNSLGGNARTAIICTMSPAQTHLEQSRNTLFFATQAKEVTNTAQVNMVVSDKDMVKLLQKEVARLEAELRIPVNLTNESTQTLALLNEKEAVIQQLRAEVKELHYQRDLAQAELDQLRMRFAEEEARKTDQECFMPSPIPLSPQTPDTGTRRSANDMVLCLKSTDFNQSTPKQRSPSLARQSVVRQSPTASMMLIQEIRKLEQLQDELGEDANKALEALQKEFECVRLAQHDMNQDAASTIAKLQEEIRALKVSGRKEEKQTCLAKESINCSLREKISRLHAMGSTNGCTADSTITTLEEKLISVQKSLNNLVLSSTSAAEPGTPVNTNSPDCRKRQTVAGSPRSIRRTLELEFENDENNPPEGSENTCPPIPKPPSRFKRHEGELGNVSLKENTVTTTHRRNNSVDIKKMQSMFKTAAEENINSIRAYVMELKERVAKLQYQKQLLVCQVLELEANGSITEEDDTDLVRMDEESYTPTPVPQSLEDYQLLFQKERMQIAQLWDLCHVSIIHRSQFYLLFKGDPADQVYLEVELRRLAWLQEHLDAATAVDYPDADGEEDGDSASLAASCRALKKEREQIAKRMRTSLTEEERQEMYQRWGIPLGAKQRKLQVAYRVWTDPHDQVHLQDSAKLVARVMGFWNPKNEASKEMFELAFAPPSSKKPWLQAGWNTILNNLNALNI